MAANTKAKPPTDELGSASIVQWGGVLSDFDVDYAQAWRMPDRWATTEKMRNDPAVASCLAALTYPILAAELKIEPASNAPEDRELADAIQSDLENMSTPLLRHRAEALHSVAEGVRVFEIVYPKTVGTDGRWHLRKLVLRQNKSIQKWHVDDTGGPDGVTQLKENGGTQRIPMDRLVAFTHAADGPSLLGRPALRPMYRPWYVLDKMSRIGSMAIERHGVGVPWAKYIGGNDPEVARIDAALMALHANEKLFFRTSRDVEDWGIKGVEGTMIDPVPFMEYQRRDLFLAAMAQFLALGTDGVGSMALSVDHTSFFMLALRFIAGEIEDVYTRHLIPKMIGYNWAGIPADRMPRAKHGTIDQRNALQWAQALAAAVGAGVALPADELSRVAGRLLGVAIPEPEPTAPDVEDVNDPNAEGQAASQLAARRRRSNGAVVTLAQSGRLESVVKLEALGIAVDFDGMTRALDKGKARLVERIGALQAKQAKRLLAIGKRIAAGGTVTVDGTTYSGDELVAAIVTGEVPGDATIKMAARRRGPPLIPYDEEAAEFEDVMRSLYDDGFDEVGSELEQQGASRPDRDPEVEREGHSRLHSLAVLGGFMLAERMLQGWAAAMAQSPFNADSLAAALSGGGLLESLAAMRGNEALGLGRMAGILGWGGEKVLYTAAMDGGTCSYCAAADGKEYAVKSAPEVPNSECEGMDRCRCELVPVVGDSGPVDE